MKQPTLVGLVIVLVGIVLVVVAVIVVVERWVGHTQFQKKVLHNKPNEIPLVGKF